MRKPFLDNLRYLTVLLVIFYHVFYMFNSLGIIRNVTTTGIPQFDVVMYVLYPWFMVLLFLISGICARYSLGVYENADASERKVKDRTFLKKKVRRQLLPSFAIMFLIGWTSGWVTNQYTDMFAGNGELIPGAVKYLIWCLAGSGALWFLHELFLADVVLILFRKLDKNDRIWKLCGRAKMPALCLLTLALWGSAQILNTPVIEIYRNGIYIFAFLIGYYVFSHERIQELLAKWAPILLGVSVVLAAVYTVAYWGEDFTRMFRLKSLLTNMYAWFACLAALGCAKRWMDRETVFTRYMRKNGFGFYVLHYPLMVIAAYVMDLIWNLPVWSMYLLLLLVEAAVLPPLVMMIKKIPVLRTVVLGE